MNVIYLNQHYVDKDAARVPVMDRGLLFGDAVYEVIPYFDGTPLGQAAHLVRLEQSLQHLGIKDSPTTSQWESILATLIEKNVLQHKSFSIYIQITRGTMEQRMHVPSQALTPTVIAFCMPMKTPNPNAIHKAILAEDTRHSLCHIKSTNLLANTLLLREARECGALEVILHRQGFVTECSSSNVFIVKDRIIRTPPESNLILSGITRALVLKVAQSVALECRETPIEVTEMIDADEVWVTSSTKLICPITHLNDQIIGNGTPGPVWDTIIKAFHQAPALLN